MITIIVVVVIPVLSGASSFHFCSSRSNFIQLFHNEAGESKQSSNSQISVIEFETSLQQPGDHSFGAGQAVGGVCCLTWCALERGPATAVLELAGRQLREANTSSSEL